MASQCTSVKSLLSREFRLQAMSQEATRHWGVTAPISLAASPAHELELDFELLNILQDLGLYENEHDAQKR